MKKFAILIVGIVTLSSCTTSLKSTKIENPDPENLEIGSGLSYKLPLKRISLEIAGEITNCSVDANGKGYSLDAKVTSNVSTSIEGDNTQIYLLDYQALKSKTKTQELNVTVGNNGTLTSINSNVNDKTGPILTNVASAVFSLAQGIAIPNIEPAGGSGPGLKGTEPGESVKITCPENITKKLKFIQDAEKQISALQITSKSIANLETQINNKNLDIEKIRLELAFNRENKANALEKISKKILYKTIGERVGLEIQLAQLKKKPAEDPSELKTKIDKTKTDLSFRIIRSVAPEKSICDVNYKLTLTDDPSFIQRMFYPNRSELNSCSNCPEITLKLAKLVKDECKLPSIIAYIEKPLATAVPVLLPQPSKDADPRPDSSTVRKSNDKPEILSKGIYYRVPANAEFELKLKKGKEELVLHKSVMTIPQFGYIATLDLTNKPFEETNLSVNFDDNGAISRLNFTSNAQALAASSAAKDVFGGYLNFVKENEKAKYESKKQYIELSKAGVELDKAKSDLNLTNSNNELATSNNSVQLLKNLIQLQASQSGNSSSDFDNIGRLERENQVLNLMIENAKKQKELQELQKTLTVVP